MRQSPASFSFPGRRTAALQLQRIFRTFLHAFHTQNALCPVFSSARTVGDLHIHRTNPFAPPTGDACGFVHPNTEKRKIRHGLQKKGDGTNVFTKCSVVLAQIGQGNSNHIVEDVAHKEAAPHNLLFIGDLKKEKQAGKKKRAPEHKIPDRPPAPAGRGRSFEREQV